MRINEERATEGWLALLFFLFSSVFLLFFSKISKYTHHTHPTGLKGRCTGRFGK